MTEAVMQLRTTDGHWATDVLFVYVSLMIFTFCVYCHCRYWDECMLLRKAGECAPMDW